MTAPTILFIDHSYHQHTQSSEFFFELLKTIGTVDRHWDESWRQGAQRPNYVARAREFDIVVVFQLPEVIENLVAAGHPNLVYVPMYDAAYGLSRKFWKSLRSVKVLCFSAALFEICTRYRLRSYYIRYYPVVKTEGLSAVNNRSLFIWQRRERPSWHDVAAKIPGSQFDRIHLHSAADPENELPPPPTLWERTHLNITTSTWFDRKEDLELLMRQFAYYFAPRDREGIGFSFLDAMAMGLVVISLDFPTANEYLIHGLSGYLLNLDTPRFDLPTAEALRDKSLHYMHKGRKLYERHIGEMMEFVRVPTRRNALKPPARLLFELRKHVKIEIEHSRLPMSSGGNPLVSVITVSRNDLASLSRTMNSVFSQLYDDFEYLVVDGASTDGSVALLRANEGNIDKWVSEPDQGPYDAMMKGARMARGRYVLFMNAGDEFFGPHALTDAMLDAPDDADIIYGHHFYISSKLRHQVKLAADLAHTYSNLVKGNITHRLYDGIPCHQSTLVRRELLVELGFDPAYKIAADHNLLFAAVMKRARLYHTNTFISKYYSGGMSAKQSDLCRADWISIALRYTQHPAKVKQFWGVRD